MRPIPPDFPDFENDSTSAIDGVENCEGLDMQTVDLPDGEHAVIQRWTLTEEERQRVFFDGKDIIVRYIYTPVKGVEGRYHESIALFVGDHGLKKLECTCDDDEPRAEFEKDPDGWKKSSDVGESEDES